MADERLASMDSFLMEDQQSTISGPVVSVSLQAQSDVRFGDARGFESKWSEEAQAYRSLEEALRQGDNFISMVYTYRSASKALPTVKSADQGNKDQIYQTSYEVLEPEIKKLKGFMVFANDCVKLFCAELRKIVPNKARPDWIPSETMVRFLVRLLDLFAVLDALKNMKASFNNDFSFFKRALGFIRKSASGQDDQTQENHLLYLFLANQNSITTNLRAEVCQIPGFEDAILMLVNESADFFEQERYLKPQDKHRLLRVMPYGLALVDSEKFNIFKDKRVRMQRYLQIFKKNPIVPLYGDMQTTLETFIKGSQNFDERVWNAEAVDVRRVAIEYDLIAKKDQTRADHDAFLAQFSQVIGRLKRDRNATPNANKKNDWYQALELSLNGLQLMARISSSILEHAAWKYSRPNMADTEHPDALDYERVIRHNYSLEERFALVEFIGMLKGLAAVFLREEAFLSQYIRLAVHDELQDFIQNQLRDLIRQVSKSKKKGILRNELLQLRSLAADWGSGIEPTDPALYGKKDAATLPPIPVRPVAPSLTQLELIRSCVMSLMQTSPKKKEFSGSEGRTLERFSARSFFYRYLLDLQNTVLSLADLGDLWYREFYLELSKRLQFPIEMSLPWILTDSIVESQNTSMLEFVLYPLEIYNDAASRALNALNQRFLFDEVEAELNLAFDQLIYKLSEQVFTYFKTHVSAIMLDKPYKGKLEVEYSIAKFQVPRSRFAPLFSQRHFHLLGRSIDLNHMIAQRMNTLLRDNLELAIRKFEASDLTGVLELEAQLENARATHRALSRHFELENFDTMLREANDASSLVSLHGRIALHIIYELLSDFAPNFVFNSVTSRWLRTSLSYAEEVSREAPPRERNPALLYGTRFLNLAYQMGGNLEKRFIGMPHILAMLRLIGSADLALVVGELFSNIELKIQSVLAPYVRECMSGMPVQSKLPIYDYGSEGSYGYFALSFGQLLQYPDLRPEVFQNFRELGNYLTLFAMMEDALVQINQENFTLSAPFLGITAENLNSSATFSSQSSPLFIEIQQLCAKLENTPGSARAPQILQDIVKNSLHADQHYRPTEKPLSLFRAALLRLDRALDAVRSEWNRAPENGVLNIDASVEFFRLWSALQFIHCMPCAPTDTSSMELFGDSFAWGGLPVVYFLRQQALFEVFDVSYHTLNIEEANPGQRSADTQTFMRNVVLQRDLNALVFAKLRAHAPLPDQEDIVVLKPPREHTADQWIESKK